MVWSQVLNYLTPQFFAVYNAISFGIKKQVTFGCTEGTLFGFIWQSDSNFIENQVRNVLKDCKISHSIAHNCLSSTLNFLYSRMANFAISQNVPEFVLVIRTVLFFIRFKQIWYQNKREMFLLLLMYFNLHWIKQFPNCLDFYKWQGTLNYEKATFANITKTTQQK